MSSLDLALVGNGTIGCLIDAEGGVAWGCFPRFDGDPAFCSLLRGHAGDAGAGVFTVDVLDHAHSEQAFLENTPILITRKYDHTGGCIEITDVAPRFQHFARLFCPMTLVRRIRRVSGHPRIRVRLHPAHSYGKLRDRVTAGSNHIRYEGGDVVLRLTTDVSITAVLEEQAFYLHDTATLILGSDESVQGAVGETGRRLVEQTTDYWREWVRNLAIPFEWQDAVIRAAIALQLNVFEDTGAVIAAMTTSIPESPSSGRNWDYRYCWLRDTYFVVNAMNRLGATRTMEMYLQYIFNIVAGAEPGTLQPVYGISGRSSLEEREVSSLDGYRGMGPVRVGNLAYQQRQNDVYGSVILAATQLFVDRRLVPRGDEVLFKRLESLGERAAALYDQPDAGIWERRGTPTVHTFSSVMCWAGCDRLARIANLLGFGDRAKYWRAHAEKIHAAICEQAWNEEVGSFMGTLQGTALDASLLRLNDVGFLAADDPRFAGTVRAIEKGLRHGDFIFRYTEEDDFGKPVNAFLACTFWYINALAALGRKDEARALFEKVLDCRNRHGLLAEDIDPTTKEQWGNFVQTYSMVGLIDAAIRLSSPWDQAF